LCFDNLAFCVFTRARVMFNFFFFNIRGTVWNMIHSYKGIAPTIAASCYVDDSAQIIGDVVLGEHASVWMNAVLRGDVHSIRVGAHSNVQDCSVLHGMKEQYGVFLGEYVTVGHSVTLHGCVIEDRCLIGMGSIILNGARIGAELEAAGGEFIEGSLVLEENDLAVCLAPGLKTDAHLSHRGVTDMSSVRVHVTASVSGAYDETALADGWKDRVAVALGEKRGALAGILEQSDGVGIFVGLRWS